MHLDWKSNALVKLDMLKKCTGRTQAQLFAENEDLRTRLDEAEETLSTIRSGNWDALIISGVGGEQIITLKQSELRTAACLKQPRMGS